MNLTATRADAAAGTDAADVAQFDATRCEHDKLREACWHHQYAAAAATGRLVPEAVIRIGGPDAGDWWGLPVVDY
ncbi:hypothetical protein [Geodermatophilus ruber]|uniref:Uncharacterized protein n=1 Tax=Geodermatophilus ruber TaxID=504800 RepID=A0A1I3Z373_9ACTN|nr:hypothetical protein [Geodermatophilus ruber]SFK38450.1 hypothetical protein SAMN04488085_101322 [Geodermatophilus ruber]